MRSHSIARKLILWIVLFSSVITLFLTAFQIYTDYKKDVNGIHETINKIELSLMGTLSSNLWLDDREELGIALKGIGAFPDISYVAILVDGNVYASSGSRKEKQVVIEMVPVEYVYNGKKHTIGVLHTEADLSPIYQRLLNRFWIILASNALKTLLVAAFIFLIVNKFIISKLALISEFINSHDDEDFSKRIEYVINSSEGAHDEIDNIAESLNRKQAVLEGYFKRQKEIEQALVKEKNRAESASKAKSDFLSRMSHELRTPMNAILGFSQLLDKDKTLSPVQQESIKEIIMGGNHLLDLIDEVLDLGRIESGKFQCDLELCNLNSLLESCISMIKPMAKDTDVTLNIGSDLSGELKVDVDPKRFKQVVINLLSNAIKYNVQNGSVLMNSEIVDDEFAKITVVDTGLGIDESDLENIYQPFERVGQYKGVDGAGIGLTISKSLVEAMGGKIEVKSELGKGSTFAVYVKLAPV